MSRPKKTKRGKQLCAAMKRDIATVVRMYLATEEEPMQAVIRTDAWIRKAYEPHRWLKAHRYAYLVVTPKGETLRLSTYDVKWIRKQWTQLAAELESREARETALWGKLHRYYDGLVPLRAYAIAGVEPPQQVNP